MQEAVAEFLDRETAKIDALIAKQAEFLALLDEHRRALITAAVTHGLDPSMPTRETETPWIGSIPRHWQMLPLKRIAIIQRGKFTHRPRNDPEFYDGAYPFIQTGDVSNADDDGIIQQYTQTLNDQGLAVSMMFPKGTLAMGIAATVAKVAILGFSACFPDSVVGITARDNSEQDYLLWLLRAAEYEMIETAIENTQLNLNIERVGSLIVPVPPKSEQLLIAEFLKAAWSKINVLSRMTKTSMKLLNERRTALITAAVTGQIDVTEPALTEVAA